MHRPAHGLFAPATGNLPRTRLYIESREKLYEERLLFATRARATDASSDADMQASELADFTLGSLRALYNPRLSPKHRTSWSVDTKLTKDKYTSVITELHIAPVQPHACKAVFSDQRCMSSGCRPKAVGTWHCRSTAESTDLGLHKFRSSPRSAAALHISSGCHQAVAGNSRCHNTAESTGLGRRKLRSRPRSFVAPRTSSHCRQEVARTWRCHNTAGSSARGLHRPRSRPRSFVFEHTASRCRQEVSRTWRCRSTGPADLGLRKRPAQVRTAACGHKRFPQRDL